MKELCVFDARTLTSDDVGSGGYVSATKEEIIAHPCVQETLKTRDELVSAVWANLLCIRDTLAAHPGNFMQEVGGPASDSQVRRAYLEAEDAIQRLATHYPLEPKLAGATQSVR